MAHRKEVNAVVYDPELKGAIDFTFFETSAPRTRSNTLVRTESAEFESTQIEGNQSGNSDDSCDAFSTEPSTMVSAASENTSRQDKNPMKSALVEQIQTELTGFSSEESEGSDHSDSSDDDNPRSQVDKLIEMGTLEYMEGENSNVSSESELDSESDSESDITDVSPLVSATASPLGLSPVMARRSTLVKSPLTRKHDESLPTILPRKKERIRRHTHPTHSGNCRNVDEAGDPTTDMTLLARAVAELEKKRDDGTSCSLPSASSSSVSGTVSSLPGTHHHHTHTGGPRRKNMSFTNEDVRRIDRENKILLQKIVSAHTRGVSRANNTPYTSTGATGPYRNVARPSTSAVNRRRDEEKIRRENMILLRKIQEVKPSRDLTNGIHATNQSHSHHHRSHHHHHFTSPSPPMGLCRAAVVSIPGHGGATPRKETAL